jgi:hypothetical protein
MQRIQRSIRLRPEVDEGLRLRAVEQDVSVSSLIEHACIEHYGIRRPMRTRKRKGDRTGGTVVPFPKDTA